MMIWFADIICYPFFSCVENVDAMASQTAKLYEAGQIDRDTMMDAGTLTQLASHAILEIDSFVVMKFLAVTIDNENNFEALKPQQVFQLTKTLVQG